MSSKDKLQKTSPIPSSKPGGLKSLRNAEELKIEFARLARWSIAPTEAYGRIPGKGSPSPLGWVATPHQHRSITSEARCDFAMTHKCATVSFRLIPRPRMAGGNWYVDVEFTSAAGCSARIMMDLTAILRRPTFESQLDGLGIDHHFAGCGDGSARAAEATWRKYLRDHVHIPAPNSLSGCDLAFWRGF